MEALAGTGAGTGAGVWLITVSFCEVGGEDDGEGEWSEVSRLVVVHRPDAQTIRAARTWSETTPCTTASYGDPRLDRYALCYALVPSHPLTGALRSPWLLLLSAQNGGQDAEHGVTT